MRKISKSVVAHYKISPAVYQDWIETYLEQAENYKKLVEFRDELRLLANRERQDLNQEFTKEDCLNYARKLFEKIDEPKSMLLI